MKILNKTIKTFILCIIIVSCNDSKKLNQAADIGLKYQKYNNGTQKEFYNLENAYALLSESMKKKVENLNLFDFSNLGEVKLKGKAKSLNLFAVKPI